MSAVYLLLDKSKIKHFRADLFLENIFFSTS